jgi:hypothetical protein
MRSEPTLVRLLEPAVIVHPQALVMVMSQLTPPNEMSPKASILAFLGRGVASLSINYELWYEEGAGPT